MSGRTGSARHGEKNKTTAYFSPEESRGCTSVVASFLMMESRLSNSGVASSPTSSAAPYWLFTQKCSLRDSCVVDACPLRRVHQQPSRYKRPPSIQKLEAFNFHLEEHGVSHSFAHFPHARFSTFQNLTLPPTNSTTFRQAITWLVIAIKRHEKLPKNLLDFSRLGECSGLSKKHARASCTGAS